jgi:hypothetical protein
LGREAFVAAQVNAASSQDSKAAALAFSVLTLTRTYRPIFPKSSVLNPKD